VPSGWTLEYGGANISVTQDAGAPKSPPNLLRVSYPTGFTAGEQPCKLWFTAGQSAVFCTYWIRYDPTFEGHSSGVNKQMFILASNGNPFYSAAMFTGQSATCTYDAQLEIMTPSFVWANNLGGVSVQKAQWNRVSWFADRRPSAGSQIFRMWTNGTMTANRTNCTYAQPLQEFQIAPTWGGIGGTYPSPGGWFELDEVQIWTT
jgi:hypothetical protein